MTPNPFMPNRPAPSHFGRDRPGHGRAAHEALIMLSDDVLTGFLSAAILVAAFAWLCFLPSVGLLYILGILS